MISKIAKEYKNNTVKDLPDRADTRDFAVGAIGASLSGLASLKLSDMAGEGLDEDIGVRKDIFPYMFEKKKISEQDAQKIMEYLDIPKDKVNVDMSGIDKNFLKYGPHYNPLTNEVHVSRLSSPYVLAHELGHASGYRSKNDLLSKLMEYGTRGGRVAYNLSMGTRLPIGAFAGAYKAYRDKMRKELGSDEYEENNIDTGLSAGRNISALGYGTTLAEEGRASIKGLNAIENIYGEEAAREASRKLGKAWLTYAARGLGPFVLAPAVGNLIAKYRVDSERRHALRNDHQNV